MGSERQPESRSVAGDSARRIRVSQLIKQQISQCNIRENAESRFWPRKEDNVAISPRTHASRSLSAARSATHLSSHTVESKETRECSHQRKIAPLYPLNAHTIPPVVCPLAQLDPEAALRLLPQRLLHLVHLLIRQRAVHRPIGYPVAMARLALLRVGELVD